MWDVRAHSSHSGWRSSMAEQRFCKPQVGGSIPLASSTTSADDSTSLRLTAPLFSLKEGENHAEVLQQAKLTLMSTKFKPSILGRHET